MSLGSISNSGDIHFWKQSATEMVRTKSNLNGLVFPEFKALIFGATWFNPGTNFTNLFRVDRSSLEVLGPKWPALGIGVGFRGSPFF